MEIGFVKKKNGEVEANGRHFAPSSIILHVV